MIPSSELIINSDGTIFHLHITSQYVADTVILVGDPSRADTIASKFDRILMSASNREFRTHKGIFLGKEFTVISTGIGCDNIDIVMTELDAVVNVDLTTREVKPTKRSLNIIRLGTSGALQDDIKIGDYVASRYSLGIDGLAHFYKSSVKYRETELEKVFILHNNWSNEMAAPYVLENDIELLKKFTDGSFAKEGITISAGGFYAPQGRVVRLELASSNYLKNIESFVWKNIKITNFEMEGSAIALLGKMLGHKTLTVCAIIAQRTAGESNPDYEKIIDKLITKALHLLCK